MQARDKIQFIKAEFMAGGITYDEAKAKAQPVIDEMNLVAKRVAKEHGMRHKPISFINVFR